LTSLIDACAKQSGDDGGQIPSQVGENVKWNSSAVDPYHLMFANVLLHEMKVLGNLNFKPNRHHSSEV